jgi:hypothetical protein
MIKRVNDDIFETIDAKNLELSLEIQSSTNRIYQGCPEAGGPSPLETPLTFISNYLILLSLHESVCD